MSPSEHPPRRRPFAVTAIVVLVGVQALVLIGLGTYLILGEGDREVAEMIEVGRADVGVSGALLVALGAVPALVALGLARGSELARSVLAALVTLQLAPSVYALVALQDVRAGSITTLVLAVAVLWLLYGDPTSEEFFTR